MRRSQLWPTVTLVGLAVLMASAFAVGLWATQAAHNHCLNGCGKDKNGKLQTPPGCCEQPDCEFDYLLKRNTANVRSVAHTGKQGKFGPGGSQWVYKGPTPAQMASVVSMFGKFRLGSGPKPVLDAKAEALSILGLQFADCLSEKPFIEEPPFKVDPDYCTVTQAQNGQPVVIDTDDPNALEKAKDAAPQCRESVEADFIRAKTLHDICKRNNGLSGPALQDAEQQAAEAAQRSIQEQLSQFLDSCKPFKNKFKSARDAVKKAEQLLKDSGGKNIPQNQRKLSGLRKK